MLLAVALVGGCSSYSPPQLNITGVRVAQESPEGMVIELSIDASNTNEKDMPLERLTYQFSLGGRPVFSGTRSAEATVRRLGTQSIVLPAAIDFSRFPVPQGQVEYEVTGSLVYVAPGELAQILFDVGVRRPSVRFSHRGTLDFGQTTPTDQP